MHGNFESKIVKIEEDSELEKTIFDYCRINSSDKTIAAADIETCIDSPSQTTWRFPDKSEKDIFRINMEQ